jgi:hypothetical protein
VELDGPAVSALRRAITELSNVGQNSLSQAPPCFGRPVKPLIPAAIAVVRTYQPALGPRGGFSLCVTHKEGLCLSSGDINRLIMMMMINMHK